MIPKWTHTVRAYYRDGRGLAYETRHSGQTGAQIELSAASSRDDIGYVVIRHYDTGEIVDEWGDAGEAND